MRNKRGNVNEVALSGFGHKLQPVAPPQPGYAIDHVDHAFEVAVVVGTGLGLGINGDSAGPKLCCASALGRHCGTPLHPQSLCCAVIQLVAANDPHTIRSPSLGSFTHVWSRRALIHTKAISVTIPAPER